MNVKNRLLVCTIGCFIAYISQAHASSYTWSGATGGSWSTTSNWTPNDGGTTYPTTGDTATIANSASNQTIIYDASASGTLGTLSFTQTTAGVTNTLDIVRSLTVTNSFTLGGGAATSTSVSNFLVDTTVAYSTTSTTSLNITVGGGSGTLTISTGGQLTLASYAYWNSTNNAWYYTNPKITGNVVLNGGTLTVPAATMNVASGRQTKSDTTTSDAGAVVSTITGTLTISSGTLRFGYGDTYSATRLEVSGNFTMTGGTIYVGSGGGGSALNLTGTTNVLKGFTMETGSSGLTVQILGDKYQTFETDAYISGLNVRASGTYTKKVTSLYTGTIDINTLQFGQGTANKITTMQLGSDLSVASLITGYGVSSSTTGSAIDLNDYNLNLTPTSTWTPANAATGKNVNWYITNTGSGTSVVTADSFNLSSANQVNIGYTPGSDVSASTTASTGNVVLKATGVNANNLGGSGLINPNSKFWYVGTSSTLTANRTIGKLEVGNGSTASTLKIITTNLTTAGDVKVNANSFLDLGGKTLTLSGSANLTGFGGSYISTASGSSIAFATGATGGLSPGGAAGSNTTNGQNSVGYFSVSTAASGNTNFSTTGVQLVSTSTSWFDILGDNSTNENYDYIDLNSVAITYAGTLYVNFMSYTPTVGESWELFVNEGTVTGDFTTISSSNAGYVFDFNETTGTLTLLSIPEPQTVVLLIFSLILLAFSAYTKRAKFHLNIQQ